MSTTPPIQYSGPKISETVPWETRVHLQALYQKLGNHTQAFSLLKQQAASAKAVSTTTIISGEGGSVSSTATGIPVNDQSGVTTYATVSGDDGALIVFSAAGSIAASLTTQTPPWSCFVTNLGAGTATLTPISGTISYAGHPGAASMPIASGGNALVAFDGTNWWAELSISSTGPIPTAYLKGTVNVATGGASSGTFTGTGTVAGAATTMCAVASPYSPLSGPWVFNAWVSGVNTVSVTVTLPNISPATWGTIPFAVVVFP
jgi:hypothetical protein